LPLAIAQEISLTTSPAKPLRAFYAASIADFIHADPSFVLGCLSDNSGFSIETTQRDAWRSQISILQNELLTFAGKGSVLFEFSVPRLGKRIDVLALIDHVIFVIEFKVGEALFNRSAVDQVWDYALDLKNFHETSHHCMIAPLLVATHAKSVNGVVSMSHHNDGVLKPINTSPEQLKDTINTVLQLSAGDSIDATTWEAGRYRPTPTIIEAASALYGNHSVADLSRSDAGEKNLAQTSVAIGKLIAEAQATRKKAICFVTGVPGAGKTLVGLDVATKHMDAESDLHSVYLSGNGPLVSILREALTRDEVARKKAIGQKLRKGEARKAVDAFIQNVHHFRDAYLADEQPPVDHVVIFDEAQRAWTLEQTTQFMARKKGRPDFNRSEPDFLISCLDRHPDWSVVICLVGGGQEINTGEAGIGEWLRAIHDHYPDWEVHISPHLQDSEYGAGAALATLKDRANIHYNEDLHLAVSMRSFRAEHVSTFVKYLLDRQHESARAVFQQVQSRYPIVITRDLDKAKRWLREKARGTERFGMVVSSQAQRLKPHAIDVRSPMDPIHWFLDDKDDVRSSYYLEDVATEFHVQGLELDWACVVWDADLRYGVDDWEYRSFVGSKWQKIHLAHRQMYLKNAYRVLLTRARQGMVIVIPPGDHNDPTRDPAFYDPVYSYLADLGIKEI
jgi:catechol 2,3-dioxygenase-like lactoylglutathione lyase family enzyme